MNDELNTFVVLILHKILIKLIEFLKIQNERETEKKRGEEKNGEFFNSLLSTRIRAIVYIFSPQKLLMLDTNIM